MASTAAMLRQHEVLRSAYEDQPQSVIIEPMNYVNPLQCAAARRTPHAAYSNIDHCARALQV